MKKQESSLTRVVNTHRLQNISKHLQPPTIEQKSISIHGFGSDGLEEPRLTDKVELLGQARGGSINVVAYVVLTLCKPLHCQFVNQAKNEYPHLKELYFADLLMVIVALTSIFSVKQTIIGVFHWSSCAWSPWTYCS